MITTDHLPISVTCVESLEHNFRMRENSGPWGPEFSRTLNFDLTYTGYICVSLQTTSK